MKFLKRYLGMIVAALATAVAVFAAARQQQMARKWQDTATGIEEGTVTRGTLTAEAASTKAKLHQAKAEEIKAKAEKRVANRDESTADILRRWG